MDDLISRQAAIRWVKQECNPFGKPTLDFESGKRVMEHLERMPSVQPEIIRCKDCKYRDENWRRVSVRWLPCMDMRTGSNWYCGSAERGEQDAD